MDSLRATYKESEEDEEEEKLSDPTTTTTTTTTTATTTEIPESNQNGKRQRQQKDTSLSPSDSPSESDPKSDNHDDEDEEDDPPPKKQKHISSLSQPNPQNHDSPNLDSENPILESENAIHCENNNNNSDVATPPLATEEATPTATQPKKKSKKKNSNNVWVTRSTRKGKKKVKPNSQNTPSENTVLVTPLPRHFDKNDDAPELNICLSKVNKAEKVELSEDRLSASSCKGYRMVRATRGVSEGAWYFEIKVVSLGETGHTRLGWSTEKGDLQAPVGYDDYSFGYRDIDGSKVHKALREKYGEEGYKEGDVIGLYINLPEGGLYTPRQPRMVWYKGQRYLCGTDSKDDTPKIVPGSEISFFRNGICQGVAFKDICGGRYYPAASIYTLPNQPNCTVKFNFGPDFEFFPEDFGGRTVPKPLAEVPYHGFDTCVENGTLTK